MGWLTNWIWKRKKAKKNAKIDDYNATRKRIVARRKEIMLLINETDNKDQKRILVQLLNKTDEKLKNLPIIPNLN
jgi:hypothetical protein